MKRLYDEDVYVFFTDAFDWAGYSQQIIGIFRKKDEAPPKIGDYSIWEKNPKCSITYKGTTFNPVILPPYTWCTLVHEVTHYEIGMSNITDSNDTLMFRHDNSFKELLESNLKKVDDLRKEFNKELGWDEDFVFIYHDDKVLRITPRSPWSLFNY